MCGIAGIIGEGAELGATEGMVQALFHRGPDDQGIQGLAVGDRPIVLGNTRLSIIDLSDAGHMPMSDPHTGNWIVYNGEIYNFPDIRDDLETLDDRFLSRTDTEVILKAYARWGRECVSRLRGMFAFAIWDATAQELFLARDRLGKKPLYFSQKAGTFAFASEVRALLAGGCVEPELDLDALHVYLWNGFSVAPLSLVRGIQSLLPGHWMRVSLDGHIIEIRKYWSLPASADRAVEIEEVLQEARLQMEDAVRARLISDVPLGAFLSGGLDSSALVALMAKAGGQVRTFSVTFDEPEFDESIYAQWVADRFATDHLEIRLRPDTFVDWLPDALAALDQPTFDGLNSYCVSRAVREAGLKVALSGVGADEVFGGYPFFRTVPWLSRIYQLAPARWPDFLRARANGQQHAWKKVSAPWKLADLFTGRLEEEDPVVAAYQISQMQLPGWARQALCAEHPPEEAGARLRRGLPSEFWRFLGAEIDGRDALEKVSKATLRLFLAERVLRDTDTMSMGVSLEVRAPFTDHLLLECLWKLPARLRTQGAPDKRLEETLVRPFLGDEYPARKKRGFVFPFDHWLRQSRIREMMGPVLQDRSLAKSIGLEPRPVEELFEQFQAPNSRVPWSRVWSIFVLMDWCQRHKVTL